jgi:hypothetical protein
MPLQDLKQMFIFDSGYKNKQNKQNTLKNISENLKFDSGRKSNNKQDNNDENNEKKSQGVFKNMIENITDSNAKKEISEKRKKLDNIVETPREEDKVKQSVEIENEESSPTERKKHMPFSQKITNSMAGATTKDFSELLTTKEYKEFTKKQTDRIVDALEGLDIGGGDSGGGGGGGIGIPGMDIDLPGGRGKTGTPNGSSSKPNKGSRTMRKAKVGARNLGRGFRNLPFGKIALGAASGAILYEGLTHMEDLNTDEQEKIDQYKENNPNLFKTDQDIANDPNADKNSKRVAEKNIKLQEDIKKYGEEEARNREVARNSIEERLRQRKIEKEKIAATRDKSLNADEIGNQLPKQKFTKEAGPQEPLIIPNELKNLETTSAPTTKLLDVVSEQKQELEDNKTAPAPITVINNNTNNVAGGGGQSMNFAAASPVNTDSSINDFFRSHGRIFA